MKMLRQVAGNLFRSAVLLACDHFHHIQSRIERSVIQAWPVDNERCFSECHSPQSCLGVAGRRMPFAVRCGQSISRIGSAVLRLKARPLGLSIPSRWNPHGDYRAIFRYRRRPEPARIVQHESGPHDQTGGIAASHIIDRNLIEACGGETAQCPCGEPRMPIIRAEDSRPHHSVSGGIERWNNRRRERIIVPVRQRLWR